MEILVFIVLIWILCKTVEFIVNLPFPIILILIVLIFLDYFRGGGFTFIPYSDRI